MRIGSKLEKQELALLEIDMQAGAGKDPGLALHTLEPAARHGVLKESSYCRAKQNSSDWAEPHHLLQRTVLLHDSIFSASTSLKTALFPLNLNRSL